MTWLVDWWDAIELWLVQLPYPVQVALIAAVLLPLCWVAARVMDRVGDFVEAGFTRTSARRSARRTAKGVST